MEAKVKDAEKTASSLKDAEKSLANDIVDDEPNIEAEELLQIEADPAELQRATEESNIHRDNLNSAAFAHAGLKGKVAGLKVVTDAISQQVACNGDSNSPACKMSMAQAIDKARVAADKEELRIAQEELKAAQSHTGDQGFAGSVHAAKENAHKKKLKLSQALETLQRSKEIHDQDAKAAEDIARAALNKVKKVNAADEARLMEAKFLLEYVKKAKAQANNIKIINPVAGAIKKSHEEYEAALERNQRDVSMAQRAMGLSQKLAKDSRVSPAALRKADLEFQKMTALAHLSHMEVLDARGREEHHHRVYMALQIRLENKKKDLVRAAVKKAEKEGLVVWKTKTEGVTEEQKDEDIARAAEDAKEKVKVAQATKAAAEQEAKDAKRDADQAAEKKEAIAKFQKDQGQFKPGR